MSNTQQARYCLFRTGKGFEIVRMTELELHASGREPYLLGVPFATQEEAEEQRYFLTSATFAMAH